MSSDTVVRVRGLSKCYRIYQRPSDRLKQSFMPRLSRILGREGRAHYREFWALKDVSLDIRKGETVGIVGRNGSGKSTLLQMICGTLNPTLGDVEIDGRVAALLELGSGFNPEFTGRENVYMNGTLLGLTKDQITERYDDIVDFAGIGEFIDQPIKAYSSGMMVRLAFAVQAQTSPDVLIVDEALAVGDAKFQAKCFDRLDKLKQTGTSILLVTHSSEQIVTHCDYAILLDRGSVVDRGSPRHVVNRYMDLLFGKEKRELPNEASQLVADGGSGEQEFSLSLEEDLFSTRPSYNLHEYRWGDGAASILDFEIATDLQSFPALIASGQLVTLAVSIRFHVDLVCPILGLTIKTKEGVTVYGVNSETLEIDRFREIGTKGTTAVVKATFNCRLAQGDYFLSLGLASRNGEDIVPHDRRYDAIHIQIAPEMTFTGLANLDLNLELQSVNA
ncbi:ABC transporter ATP-binding protein [Rhizobium sp. YTU87027]|uniref:ABC transporter ATP-binding protein n=1 Tax=Rhizobium sp. YTU87027 TaxID=3417741 RepID=UPI003D691223